MNVTIELDIDDVVCEARVTRDDTGETKSIYRPTVAGLVGAVLRAVEAIISEAEVPNG